jgi:hypothetical protein
LLSVAQGDCCSAGSPTGRWGPHASLPARCLSFSTLLVVQRRTALDSSVADMRTWLHAPVTGHYSPAHSPSRGRRTLADVPPAWEEPAHGNRSGSSPWSRHVRTKLPLKVAERAGVLHFHGAGWHKGSGGACNVPLSLPAA